MCESETLVLIQINCLNFPDNFFVYIIYLLEHDKHRTDLFTSLLISTVVDVCALTRTDLFQQHLRLVLLRDRFIFSNY